MEQASSLIYFYLIYIFFFIYKAVSEFHYTHLVNISQSYIMQSYSCQHTAEEN